MSRAQTHSQIGTQIGTVSGNGSTWGVEPAERLASRVKREWEGGVRADVGATLAQHPELQPFRSIVLDLAYTEYRQRVDQGETLDAEEFARRFPSLQHSLFLFIEVQKLLEQDPAFADTQSLHAWPEPGQSFLGFSLVSELGRGAFARVFLATEPALGDRPVALKLSPGGNPEAEMLGKLRHANIVPVYSVQNDPQSGLTAVCMPYLGRTTLCDVLDRAFSSGGTPTDARIILATITDSHPDWPTPDAAKFDSVLRRGTYVEGVIHLVAQLADALAYTHAQGICHQDLKPSNVLMSIEARPLLLDFNLSLDDRRSATRVGGTLPYMAPEQIRQVAIEKHASPAAPDPKSDLFALGVIFYELLSGTLPFGPLRAAQSISETAEDLLARQRQGPQPLREKHSRVDARLAHWIDRCLAFDPADRPASAEELAAALHQELTPRRRSRRWARDHRKTVGLAASTLAGMAILLGAVVATRDPYPIRLLKQGWQYYEAGDYQSARQCFIRATQADMTNLDVAFARGRTHQKLGEHVQAMEEFLRIERQTPSGQSIAALAYSTAARGFHKEAASYYEEAIRRGFANAAVMNNRGFAAIMQGGQQWDDTEQWLRKALQLDPRLQAAHQNLAMVLNGGTRKLEKRLDEAYDHLVQAIAIGPETADLHTSAAMTLLMRPSKTPKHNAMAVEHLKKTIALGESLEKLKKFSLFRNLMQEPVLKELESVVPEGEPRLRNPRTVDPLD